MAFRRSLTHRLFQMTKMSTTSPPLYHSNQFITPNTTVTTITTTFTRDFLTMSDSGEKGFIRRFLHKRAIGQTSPEFSLLGDKIREKLKGVNSSIRFDGLLVPHLKEEEKQKVEGISIEEAKKLMRVSQLEMLKAKLKRIPKITISYEEFVEICGENLNREEGLGFAKMLDDSGAVIVLGNIVFLHPEQVTKAIESLIPPSIFKSNDPRRKELEEIQKEKVMIDREAESQVKKELWAGLGFLMVQTAGFMRLTFWELSWDVMEPICFYVTSIYFMAGYAFFLRTSKEPSFEGFFEGRFNTKQKKLMKMKKFDAKRFNELKKAFDHCSSEPPGSLSFDHVDRSLVSALQHQ